MLRAFGRHFKLIVFALLVASTVLFLCQWKVNKGHDGTFEPDKMKTIPVVLATREHVYTKTSEKPIVKDLPIILESKRKTSKENILLFVAIHSAPKRIDRRNAVRETWLKKCKMSLTVACWFFTDRQDTRGKVLQGKIRNELENESRVYGDVILADSPGGLNFGRWYVWMLEWATERYDFQYILKLDDDYLICFDNLINELQFHRPKKRFIWGWLHCETEGKIYFDEAFILLTSDLIKLVLSWKSTTLLCHPFADQSIGIWMNNIPNLSAFADQIRLGDLKQEDAKQMRGGDLDEVCHTRIGIHQVYPKDMKIFWNIYEKEKKDVKRKVPSISFDCKLPRGIDLTNIRPRFMPKLCKDNPIYNFGDWFQGTERKRSF